jgi:hypothetical protein
MRNIACPCKRKISVMKFRLLFQLTVIIAVFKSFAECPCDSVDNFTAAPECIDADRLDTLIDSCLNCRNYLGIELNPCNLSILRYFRSREIDDLNFASKRLFLKLQKKCLDFQEDNDYKANLCDDPYLHRMLNKQSIEQDEITELLKERCIEFKDDNRGELKKRYTEYEIDIRQPSSILDGPPKYKPYFAIGAALLPLGAALAPISISTTSKLLDGKLKTNVDPLFMLLVLAIADVASVATFPGSMALFTIGDKKRKKCKQYQTELEILKSKQIID